VIPAADFVNEQESCPRCAKIISWIDGACCGVRRTVPAHDWPLRRLASGLPIVYKIDQPFGCESGTLEVNVLSVKLIMEPGSLVQAVK